jgi:hypothetical protein
MNKERRDVERRGKHIKRRENEEMKEKGRRRKRKETHIKLHLYVIFSDLIDKWVLLMWLPTISLM